MVTPGTPSQEAMLAHADTHVPHRSWCTLCVQGKARQARHRRTEKVPGELPVVQAEYCFLGCAGSLPGQEGEEIVILTAVDDVNQLAIGGRPTMSHVTAWLEMERLMTAIMLGHLVRPAASSEDSRDAA